jgi:hypothetical protein
MASAMCASIGTALHLAPQHVPMKNKYEIICMYLYLYYIFIANHTLVLAYAKNRALLMLGATALQPSCASFVACVCATDL